MRVFDAEVCAGTCVFGFMIEKNAMQPMLRTFAGVVDLEVGEPVVEGEDGPVAAVRQPAHVVPRVDLVFVRVDAGELLSKHVDVPLEEFADLVRGPDGLARQMGAK